MAGLEEESRRIIEAIEGGSTGGEILMALRWNIEEIIKANSEIEVELRKRMEKIIKGISITMSN
jgi:hypothetical protein